MRYLGGKFRQARHIAAEITKLAAGITSYYEPFVGGASVFDRIALNFEHTEVSDVHPDLMMMWQAVAGGWWQPPEGLSEVDYRNLRDAPVSALRGFAGFGCSYGGKWFGGYARENVSPKHTGNICAASARSVMRTAELMRRCDTKILCRSYGDLDPKPGSVIYCDPPYAGTTEYSGTSEFNHDEFWSTAKLWAVDLACIVLVSEYTAPHDIPQLYSMPARKSVGSTNLDTATERLFALGVDTRYRSLLQ